MSNLSLYFYMFGIGSLKYADHVSLYISMEYSIFRVHNAIPNAPFGWRERNAVHWIPGVSVLIQPKLTYILTAQKAVVSTSLLIVQ